MRKIIKIYIFVKVLLQIIYIKNKNIKLKMIKIYKCKREKK